MPQRRHLHLKSGIISATGEPASLSLAFRNGIGSLVSGSHGHRNNGSIRRQHGIGAVEVLVGIAVVALVSISVLHQSKGAATVQSQSAARVQASALATQELNKLYTTVSSDPSTPPPAFVFGNSPESSTGTGEAFPWPFGNCSFTPPYACSLLASAESSSFPQTATIDGASGTTKQSTTFILSTQGQWECPQPGDLQQTPMFEISVAVSWEGMAASSAYPPSVAESVKPPPGSAPACA